MAPQFDLFAGESQWPHGFAYRADFLEAAEEQELARRIAGLPFEPFAFHGFLGKRRIVSFGWQYVFDGSGLKRTEDIPAFLLPARARAAALAGLPAEQMQHVLVTEYAPGAGIGWHKDRSVFGEVVGLSLLAPARLRFRRRRGESWERLSLTAEPRSAYLLSGEARTDWEHSIPGVEALRYSITFRNFREGAAP
ncbi:alpha-ketoglutarate-dependent dioxygenase AlkB [Sphingosinicella sp. LY1275]|uniref:alpha-ketoglutarate-dependent dioxygenase AlkB n=1 Tax=Sphingosinicella sp. LY1275 TaxID=3095379 RepID=UPI002ADEE7BE|nr:alpha-ketoglutarate-dependent dioxygenase AlkB [Sphingosinicella sp. LY1275]MEA1015478.1 alpha-ketoglutarate-dependent dioxygenase AlkB [Sphingosinicella sp. LY1275]